MCSAQGAFSYLPPIHSKHWISRKTVIAYAFVPAASLKHPEAQQKLYILLLAATPNIDIQLLIDTQWWRKWIICNRAMYCLVTCQTQFDSRGSKNQSNTLFIITLWTQNHSGLVQTGSVASVNVRMDHSKWKGSSWKEMLHSYCSLPVVTLVVYKCWKARMDQELGSQKRLDFLSLGLIVIKVVGCGYINIIV